MGEADPQRERADRDRLRRLNPAVIVLPFLALLSSRQRGLEEFAIDPVRRGWITAIFSDAVRTDGHEQRKEY